MIKKGEYSISDIYQGGYSSLAPSYGNVFTGYRTSAASLGLTTDPRTANVLQDVSAKLTTGVKHMELSTVSPDIFESIPKQQLTEVRRKAKLAGAEVSVHAPVVEASGISKEGFSESNREAVERQMSLAVERSHELNPDGNIPVTFHSSAMIPQPIPQKGKEPEETFVINAESGSLHRIPLAKSRFPGEEKEKIDVKEEINKINERQWGEEIRSLDYYTNIGEREIRDSQALSESAEAERKAGREVTALERDAGVSFRRGLGLLQNSYGQLQNLFDRAMNHATEEQDKNNLRKFYENIKEKVEQIKQADAEQDNSRSINLRKEIIDEGSDVLRKMTPEIFKPLDEFAKERTIKTFGNVAFNSYNKFKGKSPIISIENPPAGGAFSTGKELKEVVEGAREQFIERAKKEGMSEKEARAAAERTIGVTWDVGHINMLRRYGYEAEDIIKESEKVAPLVKHVHLSDNFGFEHTELPMGMGNVPLKEMMEKLGKKGEEAKKIIEAGNWWQHFKTPPFKETLQATGSPIYSMYMAPYWNQAMGLWQGYYGGMGATLPQGNYETWGAGFMAQLPTELGGQRPGAQGGRMGGKPME